ncbi:HET-domain-containing protein, partial [Periconia macrospinosa]
MKNWITFCQKHHTQLCSQKARVSALTVIDCEICQVVELPSASPYLTLSYVWGSAQAFEGIDDECIQDVPRVINDAFHAVRSLGFRYLWIDRYCIPQGDAQEKQRLIQNMGAIYKSSALTLIAAAGDGPHYGLPGIRPGLRRARPTISIGPWALIPQETGFVSEINESKWNSRGWTYQEAILSHRKLVFTNSQTYFQCQAMHCLE